MHKISIGQSRWTVMYLSVSIKVNSRVFECVNQGEQSCICVCQSRWTVMYLCVCQSRWTVMYLCVCQSRWTVMYLCVCQSRWTVMYLLLPLLYYHVSFHDIGWLLQSISISEILFYIYFLLSTITYKTFTGHDKLSNKTFTGHDKWTVM